MSFITDIEILNLRTEKLLYGYYTELSFCDSWQCIKLSYDNCIKTITRKLKEHENK